MIANRSLRGLPLVGWKAERGALVAAWVHTTRISNKIASHEAALTHGALSSPPFRSALVAPSRTVRSLSTGASRSQYSPANIPESSWHGRVFGGHDMGCSRLNDVVGRTPRVRTLTSGSCPAIQPTGRSERGGMEAVRRGMSAMCEGDFHAVADEELEEIHDAVEEALEEGFEGDFDCNLAQGVLNIVVSDRGTWVINKQSPNRQIWWSSPISGPMRFEYDGDKERWLNTRDGKTELRSILTAEMKDKCSISLERLAVP